MAVHGKIGFRVRTDVPRTDAELVAQFRSHATSNLADAMGRFHFMDFGIRPRSGLPLCGVAVTVDARPGRQPHDPQGARSRAARRHRRRQHERQYDERRIR